MRKLIARLRRHVDVKSDKNGFGLRVWLGPIYAELFHDRPTKEVDFRLLYGEGEWG